MKGTPVSRKQAASRRAAGKCLEAGGRVVGVDSREKEQGGRRGRAGRGAAACADARGGRRRAPREPSAHSGWKRHHADDGRDLLASALSCFQRILQTDIDERFWSVQ